MELYEKTFALSVAAGKRLLTSSSPFLFSSSSAPSVNVEVKKLQECPEECDEKMREAKFAFRSTDLGSWASSSSFRGGENTDTDPTTIQHWAVVVHFPRGERTYLFEAWGEDGLLQAGRAEIPFKDIQVFEKATYFGTVETSPSELMAKAKQVSTGEYNVLLNNCQTWLKYFLCLVSRDLLQALFKEVPATETYFSKMTGLHVI